jgi:hypothetical protein
MIEESPYMIEPVDQKSVIVWFCELCDCERTNVHENDLFALIDQYSRITCDVSHTQSIGTDWVRWFYRMTLKAERLGKKLDVAGADEVLRDIIDILALSDKLSLTSSV